MSRGWIWLCLVLSGCGTSLRPGEGEFPPSTAAGRAEAGREWFVSYCAACHGVEGIGNGPVAATLRTPPADLTRIAARHGGVFDGATVAGFIDGRARVPAHGTSDMPVWGRRFDDRLSGSPVDETRLSPGSIYLIVEYLRSIQLE